MSGFFAIFSGVSAALLVTSLITGLTKVMFLGMNHLMWGLIAVLLAVSVHCLIFGIFTGAGKDARELFEDLNAKSELVLKIKAFRREVFPPALYCILLLVLGAVMGGAAKNPTMVTVHFILMLVTVAYNLKTFWKEYCAVRDNGVLVAQVNVLAAELAATMPKPERKELEILEGAVEDLEWGTHVYALGSFLIFMGMNVWLPFIYFRYIVGYYAMPIWPFLAAFALLVGGGMYLRKRYESFRPVRHA